MSSILRKNFVKYLYMENYIGKKIKELRSEFKVSQSELGKMLSVSQDTISLWEHGKSLPTTEYVIALCKFFEISADYLLGLKDY